MFNYVVVGGRHVRGFTHENESVMKYHFLITIELNFFFGKTFYEGWFDWGGHLLKSNGGVQR